MTLKGVWPSFLVWSPPWLYASLVKNKQNINSRQWKDGVLPCKGQSIVIPEEVVTVPKTFIFGPETILPNNGMLLFDQSGEVYLELVSKELNHLAAILHVYASSFIFMK